MKSQDYSANSLSACNNRKNELEPNFQNFELMMSFNLNLIIKPHSSDRPLRLFSSPSHKQNLSAQNPPPQLSQAVVADCPLAQYQQLKTSKRMRNTGRVMMSCCGSDFGFA